MATSQVGLQDMVMVEPLEVPVQVMGLSPAGPELVSVPSAATDPVQPG
jgi:hypothetical protein